MRVFIYFSITFIIVVTIQGCECKDCIDKLSNYSGFFPYRNGDTVKYYNDIKGERIDTVKILYNPVEDSYCNNGKETTMECSGYIEMIIGNYRISVTQEPNFYNNKLIFANNFNNEYLFKGCLECNYFYDINDTINYEYRGNNIKAYVYFFRRNDLVDVEYCLSYTVSEDKRLLQYIIKRNSSEYTWKLK
jgi:hypothetical protein